MNDWLIGVDTLYQLEGGFWWKFTGSSRTAVRVDAGVGGWGGDMWGC